MAEVYYDAHFISEDEAKQFCGALRSKCTWEQRTGAISSYQTTGQQNLCHVRHRLLSYDLFHVAVLVDGFPVFVHHGVGLKAHGFPTYAAE
jgi:hypothetical protein